MPEQKLNEQMLEKAAPDIDMGNAEGYYAGILTEFAGKVAVVESENLALRTTVDALAFRFDCEPAEVYEKIMDWKKDIRDVLEEWEWLREARPLGSDHEGLLASHQAFLDAIWIAIWPPVKEEWSDTLNLDEPE